MDRGLWTDVVKGQTQVVFVDNVRRNFTIDDFGENILKYSAGGFKDFTRIASSSPEMWRDICLMNRVAVMDMIDRYKAQLGDIRVMVENGDSSGLLENFKRSKDARDSL